MGVLDVSTCKCLHYFHSSLFSHLKHIFFAVNDERVWIPSPVPTTSKFLLSLTVPVSEPEEEEKVDEGAAEVAVAAELEPSAHFAAAAAVTAEIGEFAVQFCSWASVTVSSILVTHLQLVVCLPLSLRRRTGPRY